VTTAARADAAAATITILGTGSYLPHRVVGNEETARRTDSTVEWIERKTQIKARRYAAEDEATSDLAARAAVRALADAGLRAEEIDYILVATSTGDSPQPPTACLVQELIGAHEAACFDLNAVCSGFVYALALARGLIAVEPTAKALVIAADLYSRSLDFDDRRTAVLLGDGAGAAVVAAAPAARGGILGVELVTRGEAHDLIEVTAGGSRLPASHRTVDEGGHFFRMQGRAVSAFVLDNVPGVIDGLLERCGSKADEIAHFIPHSANGVLVEQLVDRVGLSCAQLHRTLEYYGNVGAASVAVTLDQANASGALRDWDLVLVTAFGGGMAVGACLIEWAGTKSPKSQRAGGRI
jgi:acetoacetyl-CoA synthase